MTRVAQLAYRIAPACQPRRRTIRPQCRPPSTPSSSRGTSSSRSCLRSSTRRQIAAMSFQGSFASSVPHQLIGERVELRATALKIEIFHSGKRIFSHVRKLRAQGAAGDVRGPSPAISHKDYGKRPPERLVAWARTMGPSVAQVVEMTLAYPRGPRSTCTRHSAFCRASWCCPF